MMTFYRKLVIVISVESSSPLFAIDHVKAILLTRLVKYDSSYFMTHLILLIND